MSASTQLLVDFPSIAHNLQLLKKQALPGTLAPVIKANGYGIGLLSLAQFLSQEPFPFLCVAHLCEAVALREAGLATPLLLLYAQEEEAADIIRLQLQVSVGSTPLLHALSREARKQGSSASIHVRLDTGMGRVGCLPQEALELITLIDQTPELHFTGLMSHFSAAENPAQDPFTQEQLHMYATVWEQIHQRAQAPLWRHLSNSAALCRFPSFQDNLARVGIALLGVSTSPAIETALSLLQAVQLRTKVLAIRQLPQGWPIGYGATFKVPSQGGRYGILAMGYHDGLHRSFSPHGTFVIGGKTVPIVGNISMDSCTVDLSSAPHVKEGDWAYLFDRSNPIQLCAEKGGSIAHELLACIGPRVQRVYTH